MVVTFKSEGIHISGGIATLKGNHTLGNMLRATQMQKLVLLKFYPYSLELHTTCCLVYDGR